jgi:diguanylate cyclase (GGDEF)-like protein/PAS domain S-box-containing protein
MQSLDHLTREQLIERVRALEALPAAGMDLDFVSRHALEVLDNSGIPAFIYDTQGEFAILAANGSLAALGGYPPGGSAPATLTQALPPEDLERLRRVLRLPRQGGLAHSGTWQFQSASGELHQIAVSGYDLRFAGRPARFVILQDLTRRLRERLTQQRLAAILDATQEAMLSSTPEGVVLSWNAAAERMLGFGAADIVGRSEDMLVPAELRSTELATTRARILAGESVAELRTHRLHRSGERVPVSLSAAPLSDGEGRAIGASCVMRDLRPANRQAEAMRSLLAAIVESSQDAIISYDFEGHILSWNRGAQEIFGYSPAEIIGCDCRVVMPEVPLDTAQRLREPGARAARVAPFETPARHREGGELTVALSLAALRTDAGQLVGVTAVARDVTEQRHAERALRESERQLDSILNNAAEGMLVLSAEGAIERINLVAQRMFGCDAAAAQGVSLRQIIVELAYDAPSAAADRPGERMRRLLGARRELTGRRLDGALFPLELALSEIALAPGPSKFTAVVRDITERKTWESRIYTLAYSDSLTGLPNRLLLRDRLEHAIAAAQRNRTQVGVLFIDLDHFKSINDSYGHHVGDQLLREIADRTKGCVREIDTVCRLGGDEFVLVLPDLHGAADAGAVARKLLGVLSHPYRIDGRELTITPTVGVSIYPDHGADADTLIRNADSAMYHAKESGKNSFRVYQPQR